MGKKLRIAALTGGGVALLCLCLATVQALNTLARPYFPRPHPELSRTKYKKNGNTSQRNWVKNGEYRFKWVFRDHLGKDWAWEWGYKKGRTDRDMAAFGVPTSLLKPYQMRPDVLRERARLLRAGQFKKEGNAIVPDYEAMIAKYMGYTAPLHDLALESLGKHSRENRIRYVLKFVQDIPYGVPPPTEGNKIISGIIPPPRVFVEAFGDCDSKAVLFTSILAHDPSFKFLFLHVPMHMFVAIEGAPKPYQRYVKHRGKRYIIAEPVGPGRLDYGTPGNPYSSYRVREIATRPYRGSPNSGIVSARKKTSRSFSGKSLHIVTDQMRGNTVTLRMGSREPVEMMAELLRGKTKLERQVFIQQDNKGFVLRAVVRKAAKYTINVFTRKKGSTGHFAFALRYPFETRKNFGGRVGFPLMYTAYVARNARLRTPLSGFLTKGRSQNFEIDLPGAKKAAVVSGGKFNFLKKSGDRFQGRVAPTGKEAVLVANYSGKGNKFIFILNYQLQ